MIELVMTTIGIIFIVILVFMIICYEKPLKPLKPENTNYFRIRYNPKKDITAYEIAKLQSLLGPFVFDRRVTVDRDNEGNMKIWNSIPVLMQRHFDIVEDSRE